MGDTRSFDHWERLASGKENMESIVYEALKTPPVFTGDHGVRTAIVLLLRYLLPSDSQPWHPRPQESFALLAAVLIATATGHAAGIQ